MKRDLKFEAVYPCSPERVWQALTDPKEIEQWLMPNDFAPRLGHKFQFQTKPAPGFDGVVYCEVTVLDEPRKLAYKWTNKKLETLVSFTLEPVAEGTRLVLEHRGFESVGGLMVSAMLGRGWKNIVERGLPKVIGSPALGILIAQALSGEEVERKCDPIPLLIDRYEYGATMLSGILAEIPKELLDRQPADAPPGSSWSIRQTALHIVDAEIVGAARLRMIVAQPGATLSGYAGNAWARALAYDTQSLEPALELFRCLRQTTVAILRRLPEQTWLNQAIHEESGEVTLESYLHAHCEHAEAHMDEIETLLAQLKQTETMAAAG